jgi:hypothetical protein
MKQTKKQLESRIQYLEDSLTRYKDTLEARSERVIELEAALESDSRIDNGVSRSDWNFALSRRLESRDLLVELVDDNILKLAA